jgi:hypothetical protein
MSLCCLYNQICLQILQQHYKFKQRLSFTALKFYNNKTSWHVKNYTFVVRYLYLIHG